MVMNVSLTPELERYVNQKIASGLYQTASEVVGAGLRLLKERDEHQQTLGELRREPDRHLRGRLRRDVFAGRRRHLEAPLRAARARRAADGPSEGAPNGETTRSRNSK